MTIAVSAAVAVAAENVYRVFRAGCFISAASISHLIVTGYQLDLALADVPAHQHGVKASPCLLERLSDKRLG